jgi:hypothetical protein
MLVKGLLDVEEIPGERWRYYVTSSSRAGEKHVVDLEARYPTCRCSCEDYSCRRWPEFQKTLLADHCRHARSALIYHALRNVRENSSQLNGDGE